MKAKKSTISGEIKIVNIDKSRTVKFTRAQSHTHKLTCTAE